MTRLTAAVFLLLCCMYSWRTGCLALSSESNCLYGRLDFLNCIPHADTSWPGPNEYAFYRTKIRDRIPDCRYRNPNRNSFNEIIRPIDNLGNPNVRLLYSPGYLRNQRYPNNVLVRYNVQCPEGKLPYLFFNELDLPNKQCFGRCEDYVNVTCAACGSSESCGTQPTNNYYSLEQEHFSVTFRSSQLQRDNGFKLSVICFDPLNLPRAGCSNFVGKKKRDLEIHPITLSANEKRMLTDVTNELFNLIPSSNDIDISEIDKVCPEFCKLPPVTGYCRAAFRRWFYNSASGQCEMFLYGGCGGNKNNFMTLEECQQQCSPQPAVVPFVLRPRRLVSTAAIRNSVIFEKSCNPVVRAAADSILSIAKRQSASRVGIIRKTIDLE